MANCPVSTNRIINGYSRYFRLGWFSPLRTAGIRAGGSRRHWPSSANTDLKTVTVALRAEEPVLSWSGAWWRGQINDGITSRRGSDLRDTWTTWMCIVSLTKSKRRPVYGLCVRIIRAYCTLRQDVAEIFVCGNSWVTGGRVKPATPTGGWATR